MMEILTCYAFFSYTVTLRFLSLMGRPLNLLYTSLSVLMVVAGYIPLGPNFSGTRQPSVVSANPLTNTTLTYNASSTYTLPRKLGDYKSYRRCSSMARKTYLNLKPIRQRDLNLVYLWNNNLVYPQISDMHAIRVVLSTNKVFQSYNTGFRALG
jgi:hypothetical protein